MAIIDEKGVEEKLAPLREKGHHYYNRLTYFDQAGQQLLEIYPSMPAFS